MPLTKFTIVLQKPCYIEEDDYYIAQVKAQNVVAAVRAARAECVKVFTKEWKEDPETLEAPRDPDGLDFKVVVGFPAHPKPCVYWFDRIDARPPRRKGVAHG